MDIQQLIALAIVAGAVLFLGRSLVVSARSFFSKQSGCAGGCSKCSFAPRERAAGHPLKSSPNITMIPLMDMRTGPGRRQDAANRSDSSIPPFE